MAGSSSVVLFVVVMIALSPVNAAGSTDAVVALIDRVLGLGRSRFFTLRLQPNMPICNSKVQECAVVSNSPDGLIQIEATSVPSLGFGLGLYLRRSCNATLTWVKTGGLISRCTTKPPPVPPSLNGRLNSRSLKWTYYQNVVQSSYSNVWWSADRWRQEVDWMSLVGVNIGLVYTGQEKVLKAVYADFGVNLTAASGELDYFNGPAFLSWSRGQAQADAGGNDLFYNLSSSGALPEWWFDQQAELAKAQISMMRDLGISTILRGFENNVPEQLKQLHPTANISSVGATAWNLDALDPLFDLLSDAYMKALIDEFGTDHFYQADGYFNAARGPWMQAESDTLDKLAAKYSAAAYAGMARTDPEAVWVYQTWIWRSFGVEEHMAYLRGWISSIPDGKGLLLDQEAENVPIWRFFNNFSFWGADWVWVAMSSMGGNLGMFGDMQALQQGPSSAVDQRASITGVGIDPEGIDQNPAYYHFLLESAWHNLSVVNHTTWLQHDWATRRCGRYSESMRQAWGILGQTVYAHNEGQHYEHHMSYCPTTMPNGTGSSWDRPHGSESASWYNRSMVHKAWGLLLDAAEHQECDITAALTYDMVDVGREWLSIEACNTALTALNTASSPEQVRAANASLSEVMCDLDRLLGSSAGFA